jgi:general secretion pathway protein G
MKQSSRPYILAAVGLFLVAMAITAVWFIRMRDTPSPISCIVLLSQIEGAKEQWAAEHHKTTNDVPTDADLFGVYLNHKPVCPAGGTYTVGRVGQLPTCSIGGPSHTLPAP